MKKSVCSENSKSFELRTPKNWKCEKIKIDGSLISDQTVEKCDFAFTVDDDKGNKHTLLYVELKGSNLDKAISQLESTINLLKDDFAGYANNHAHAVCCRIVPFMTTSAQIAALKFFKRYKFVLKWHSQKGIYVIACA